MESNLLPDPVPWPFEPITKTKTEPVTEPATERKTKGRQRIPIRYIKNSRKKTACFSKRRNGILKKVLELSVLCGCDVDLSIISDTGKLYTFETTSSINHNLRALSINPTVTHTSATMLAKIIKDENESADALADITQSYDANHKIKPNSQVILNPRIVLDDSVITGNPFYRFLY